MITKKSDYISPGSTAVEIKVGGVIANSIEGNIDSMDYQELEEE